VDRRKYLNEIISALFTVCLLSAWMTTAEAQISLDAILKDCEKRTIVMGRDEKGGLVKVGERISGYCQGILEGALRFSFALGRFV
jgi:hypothetical protein